MNDEVEITIIATGFQSDANVLEDKSLNKVKQNVEAVNNFANKRYDGFPIGRTMNSAQTEQTSNYREPKVDFVKNEGVQTSRLQVEDDGIPPYLRKLREHR